jgi:hypothetical protein
MPICAEICRLWNQKIFENAFMTAGDIRTKFCKNRALPSNTLWKTHDLSLGMAVIP